MSTPDDLMLDAMRESMLDRCEALHLDDPEDGCPGCEERAQLELEDRELEESGALMAGGTAIARVRRVEL